MPLGCVVRKDFLGRDVPPPAGPVSVGAGTGQVEPFSWCTGRDHSPHAEGTAKPRLAAGVDSPHSASLGNSSHLCTHKGQMCSEM